MREFQGKVAVVTGAASGIGRALADRSAQEGMQVVLADVEEDALARTAEQLKAGGAQVTAVRTDVSRAGDVERLAQAAFDTYGAVHLLFNNAGVGGGSTVWDSSLADWQWVLGVNLWGVIHGIHYFMPRMLEQGDEGYVVNTASAAGLTTSWALGAYTVSKHAVVALSEALVMQLAAQGARIKASVLCPMWVNTRIADAERNRPAELRNAEDERPLRPEEAAMVEVVRQLIQSGMAPSQVADIVFDAIREERFYILTHPTVKLAVQARMEDILQQRMPTDIMRLA